MRTVKMESLEVADHFEYQQVSEKSEKICSGAFGAQEIFLRPKKISKMCMAPPSKNFLCVHPLKKKRKNLSSTFLQYCHNYNIQRVAKLIGMAKTRHRRFFKKTRQQKLGMGGFLPFFPSLRKPWEVLLLKRWQKLGTGGLLGFCC